MPGPVVGNCPQPSEELHLDSGTLSPLLRRLEARGLVARRRDNTDERVVRVNLTDEGRSVYADVVAAAGCLVPGFVDSGRSVPELLAQLNAITANMRALAAESVARAQKVKVDGSSVGSRVSLVPNGSGGFQLAVLLEVNVPGVEGEVAQQLADAAHQVCPYSNATRGNIEVTVSVVDD